MKDIKAITKLFFSSLIPVQSSPLDCCSCKEISGIEKCKCNASYVIIVHNHPSGNLKPGKADEQLTLKIKEAGKFLDLPLLDHLILTTEGYYSFADEGLS